MSKYPSVYLAGPITGESYGGATSWREYAIEKLAQNGIVGVSPMRGKDYLASETNIADSYEHHAMSTSKAIITRDRFDVFTRDVVLANFSGASRISIGTVMELAWADAFRKPVIVVMDAGGLHDHAFIREIAGYNVANLDDALKICAVLLS